MLHNRANVRLVAFALMIVSCGVACSTVAAADDQSCDPTADFALGREDYATAITQHRKVLQAEPENALTHYHLGFAYGMVGRAAEEVAEYQTAARLGLRNWDLFLNLGLVYLEKYDLRRAADALETSVRLGPGHAEAHFNLAIVYESQNRLDEALREISAARRLAPGDVEVVNEGAVICARMGEFASARDEWTRLAQVAPDYAPARTNLAVMSWNKNASNSFASHSGVCP